MTELIDAAETDPPPSFDERLLGPSRDLSAQLRILRLRSGISQSELARRIGVDPSVTSLWERGKTLVPSRRFRPMAEALRASLEELLLSPEDRPTLPAPVVTEPSTPARHPDSAAPAAWSEAGDALPWEAQTSDCLAWLHPAIVRGYTLDPTRIARPTTGRLLRERLCPTDRVAIADRVVCGPSLLERVHQHCHQQPAFLLALPLAETVFRLVLASPRGGLTLDELELALADLDRGVSAQQLVRLAPVLTRYPLRFFG